MGITYRQNLNRLYELQTFGIKMGLSSTENLLKRLGDPTTNTNYVHLAGTNGKGSVASIMALALEKAGYKVGLYTSPHLITFRERIKINDVMIAEDEVVELSEEIWAACDPAEPPTFFEFVTALALLYFKRQSVDWAIIETGLGGRLDSTNLITPKLSLITNISLEHTEYLGPTVDHIAREKAGIIKADCPVIIGLADPSPLEIMLETAKSLKSPAYQYGRDFTIKAREGLAFDYQGLKLSFENIRSALWGPHQRDNAALALAGLEVLTTEPAAANLKPEHFLSALKEVSWPGRAEQIQAGAWPPDPAPVKGRAVLLMDGAHNPSGAQALAAGLKNRPYRKMHLILGVMADKDLAGILGPLLPLADYLYLTRPEYQRAATPELLHQKIIAAFGEPKAQTALYPHLPEALAAAAEKAAEDDLVVLSGSLFTVGEAKAYLEGVTETESN